MSTAARRPVRIGHAPESCDVSAYPTSDQPKRVPAAIARRIARVGRPGWPSSRSCAMSPPAPIASATPTIATVGRDSPLATPQATGMHAAMTAVSGATIPIRPVANPAYRHPSATTFRAPAPKPSARSRSAASPANRATSAAAPTSAQHCATARTTIVGTRRDAYPPRKSPDPNDAATKTPRRMATDRGYASPMACRKPPRVPT